MNLTFGKKIILIVIGLSAIVIFAATGYSAGDPVKGKETFNTTCASCHGMEGKGDGAAAAALDPKPRDLSDAAYVSTLTDDHIFKAVKEGGASVGKSPMMPPWGGVLSDEKIWDVVAYIRSDICKCKHEGS